MIYNEHVFIFADVPTRRPSACNGFPYGLSRRPFQSAPPARGGPAYRPTRATNGVQRHPPSRSGKSWTRSGFLGGEQSLPACLLRLLLLRAGVESNPGPRPRLPPLRCLPCGGPVTRRDHFVWCHVCGFVHLRCSGLGTDAGWHPNFSCPVCPPARPPSPLPSTPPPTHSSPHFTFNIAPSPSAGLSSTHSSPCISPSAARTTPHLFDCPSNPTPISAEDLWARPVEAASFLGLSAD
jgi:hypothetical protein